MKQQFSILFNNIPVFYYFIKTFFMMLKI